jgi:hypothetical protein
LLDGIANVVDFPIYDEYDDDCCWCLKMLKNSLSLTLIYQPEDSSFISKNIGKVYADSS